MMALQKCNYNVFSGNKTLNKEGDELQLKLFDKN